MWCSRLCCFLVVSLAIFMGGTLRAQESKSSIDFQEEIVPILAQNCTACHNTKEAEGGLNLESYEALMKGGDTGASVVPNDLVESYLLHRITGEEEPIMPPEDNSVGAKVLNSSQIELLKTWITQGARNSATKTSTLNWHELPENVHPVYALSASLDGQHVAFGHGNRAWVSSSDFASPRPIALIDSNLPKSVTHRDLVQSIAFSPDSQRLATGGFRTVKLWRKAIAHSDLVQGLAIANLESVSSSPDRKHLAYATGKTGVEIIDLDQGKAIRFLKAHKRPIVLTHWIDDSQIVTHDSETWNLISLEAQSSSEINLGISAARKIVRVGSDSLVLKDDGRLAKLVSNDESELQLIPIDGFTDVKDICISIDGKFTAISNFKAGIRVLDWATRKETAKFQLESKEESVVAVSKDSLITKSNGKLRLWKPNEPKAIASLDKDYFGLQLSRRATQNSARQKALIDRLKKQLPELEKAATKEEEARKKLEGNRDESAKKLEAAENEVKAAEAEVASANKAIEAAKQALANAEKVLADKKKKSDATLAKKTTAAEDLAKKEQALAAAADSAQRAAAAVPKLKDEIATEEQTQAELVSTQEKVARQASVQSQVLAVAISPDDSSVFVSHNDGRVHSFTTKSGMPTGIINSGSSVGCFLAFDATQMLCISDDGQASTLAYAASWQLEKTIGNFSDSPFSDRVTALDYSPDGQQLAVGSGPPSRYGDLTLIDVNSGDVAHSFGQVHSDTIFGISFSADGRFLASCGADKLARVFNLSSLEQVRGFEGHTHHVLGVSWSDDGQTLATAGADKSVKIWNVATGEPSRTIGGFRKEVTAIRFTGQTSNVVTSSADGTVRLHDANSGKQLKTYGGTSNALFTVSLTDNNERILAAGQTGTVWTWKADDGKLIGSINP